MSWNQPGHGSTVCHLSSRPDMADTPLVFGFRFDTEGVGHQLNWADIASGLGNDRVWLHLDRRSPTTQAWLQEKSGLDKVALPPSFRKTHGLAARVIRTATSSIFAA